MKRVAKNTAQDIAKLNVPSGDTDKTPKIINSTYKNPFRRTDESGDSHHKQVPVKPDTLKREYFTYRKKEDEKIKNEAPKRQIHETKPLRNATRKNLSSKTESIPHNEENKNISLKSRKEIVNNIGPHPHNDDLKPNVSRKEVAFDKSEVKNDTTKKNKLDTANTKREVTQITTTKQKNEMESTLKNKKPLIKTHISKKDASKVYKAVTFVENKHKPALQISIPNDNVPKISVSTKATYTNMPELPQNKLKKVAKPKKKRIIRNASSPVLQCRKKSPPTEVAKWAPSFLNQHNKPYYEAWVNTKPTAVSRNSKENKLLLDEYILQNIKKSLEIINPPSPEPVYKNLSRLGKIKVTQR